MSKNPNDMMLERMKYLALTQDRAMFTPLTNLNSSYGVSRTQSCYMQPPVKLATEDSTPTGLALSKNELNYMRASCGKTSYVTYPNRSMKILKSAQAKQSKILCHKDPLELDDKPIDGLKGPLLNEMVQLH